MKRSARVMGLVLFLAVVLTAGVLSAREPEPMTTGGAAAPASRLPDLTIDKIYLTKDCRVAVVVKNLGTGIVPDEVWTVHTPKSAGVYLYKNGTGWGGGYIWKFDPAKHLKGPGGTATYVSKLKVSGTAGIKVVVDLWNVVVEANETNNSLEVKLTCEAQSGQSGGGTKQAGGTGHPGLTPKITPPDSLGGSSSGDSDDMCGSCIRRCVDYKGDSSYTSYCRRVCVRAGQCPE